MYNKEDPLVSQDLQASIIKMLLANQKLVDLQELNFKDKGSIGRDKTGEASGSV